MSYYRKNLGSLMWKRHVSVLIIVAYGLLSAACGFHLRGEVKLTPQLQRVYIEGSSAYDPLVREWTRALRSAGVSVVEQLQDATAVVQILENTGTRRVLSVRATGKVQEYELYQTLMFKVRATDGRELLDSQRLELTRDYLFDPNDVLGKSSEEEALRRDMRRDLVRLAMLRLEALSNQLN